MWLTAHPPERRLEVATVSTQALLAWAGSLATAGTPAMCRARLPNNLGNNGAGSWKRRDEAPSPSPSLRRLSLRPAAPELHCHNGHVHADMAMAARALHSHLAQAHLLRHT
jgi:hypothetical protein